MNSKPVVSIVVPIYNEELVVNNFLYELDDCIKNLSFNPEIVLVDDGSRDRTWTLIEASKNVYPHIKAIRFTTNYGKEAAICAGLRESTGDAVIVIDVDLQHPLYLIETMYKEWCYNRIKVVNAIKLSPCHTSFFKRVGNFIFYLVIRKLTNLNLTDHSDYKLLDRVVVDSLLSIKERNRFFRGLVAWLDYPSANVYFEVEPRKYGNSRWTLFALSKLAFDAITSFTHTPLRLMTFASIFFLFLMFIFSVHTFAVYLSGEAQEGFTTVILILLLVGSILSFGLGIIGEYLARIYDEVKQRPNYIIKDRI